MPEQSTVNALPKLPGFSFEEKLSQPPTFGKTQSFGVVKGMPIVKTIDTSGPGSSMKKQAITDDAILQKYPSWRTLTGKVLRFFGYFTEPVPESAVEKNRVRRVTIQFYLIDRTVTVTENPGHANAGVRGGCIMARHQEPGVDVETFRVGGFLKMRAREIVFVDCDPATREFYEKMGMKQPEAMDYPPDSFLQHVNPTKRRMDQDHIEMKQSIEALAAASSGKHSTTLTPEERIKAKRFYAHDREVLNFSATWEERHFRIMFFLSDGTMQISQIKSANDGRDPVAAFVKRGLIPKGNFSLKSIDTVSVSRSEPMKHFTDLDLMVGGTIKLFDREFYIYDCDPFTRNYYQAVHSIDQPSLPKPWTEGDPPKIKPKEMELPPYNGFGSEEDSLGSFKHMVPKPPKKDYAKYIHHANDVLRFSAELANPKAEDQGRQFIVCFYLADDTVSIFEYAVRNSGHVGGKIFARAKVANIKQEDFYVGAHIKLAGLDFILTDVDERTENFQKTGYSMGKLNDTKAEELLAKLRRVLTQRFSRVTEAYRHFNRTKSGLGIEDLSRMLSECEVQVDSPDVIAEVMQLVDLDKDGMISLQEFVENILKQSLITPTSSKAAPALSAKSYAEAQQKKTQREFADKVHKMFVAKLEARRAFIVDTFRIVSDRSLDGLIGIDTFQSVVQDRLGLNLSDEELDALVFKFFHVEQMENWQDRRLSLREFRKVLDS